MFEMEGGEKCLGYRMLSGVDQLRSFRFILSMRKPEK
jgi:hypothetical protein